MESLKNSREGQKSALEMVRELPHMAKMAAVTTVLLLNNVEHSEAKFITGIPTYTEAHKILKDSVKTDKHEQAAICIVNGQEGYCFAPEQERRASSVKVDIIDNIINKCKDLSKFGRLNQWKVLDIHTHPNYAIKSINEQFQIAPPSLSDIEHFIKMVASIYNNTINTKYNGCEKIVVSQVYDNNGVWSYTFNGDVFDYVTYIEAVKKLSVIQEKQITKIIKEYKMKLNIFIIQLIKSLDADANVKVQLKKIELLLNFILNNIGDIDQDKYINFAQQVVNIINDFIVTSIDDLRNSISRQQELFKITKNRKWLEQANNKQELLKEFEMLRIDIQQLDFNTNSPGEFSKGVANILNKFFEISNKMGINDHKIVLKRILMHVDNYMGALFSSIINMHNKDFFNILRFMSKSELANILRIDKNVLNNLLNVKHNISNMSGYDHFVKIRHALDEYYNAVEQIRKASKEKPRSESATSFLNKYPDLMKKYKAACSRLGIEINFKSY